MRNYRHSAATAIRIIYGVELAAGLRLSPETEPLADPFDALTDKLDEAHTTRTAAKKPMVRTRAKRRFTAHTMRQCIRSAARAAEIADGGRRGPIFAAVFPGGLKPQLSKGNRKLVTTTTALIDRLTKSKVTGLGPFSAEWSPKLTTALDALTAATTSFDARRGAYHDAFSTEVALRDQHRVEVERIMGQVRTAFPGDADMQDLVFPEPEEEEAEQAEEEENTTSAEPKPEPELAKGTQPPASAKPPKPSAPALDGKAAKPSTPAAPADEAPVPSGPKSG